MHTENANIYAFPQSYVPLEEVEALIERIDIGKRFFYDLRRAYNPSSAIYVDTNRLLYSRRPFEGARKFVEILYNLVPDTAVDLVEGKMVTDLVIVNPRKNIAMLIARGTNVYLFDAEGKRVYPLVDEGSTVRKGDRLFYVVTGKCEVRVVRSSVDGVVVYVGDIVPSSPPHYVMVIVDANAVKWLKPADTS